MMIRILAVILILAAPAFAQTGQRNVNRDNPANALPPAPVQIYIAENGQQIGPLDAANFQGHLGTPEAAASTLVWMPGMSDWQLASTVPQLQGIISAIGQTDVSSDEFRVSDIQSYILGVWITETFTWPRNDISYSSIIQMKVLPDGRFEGATLFWDKENPEDPMQVDHEKGTWTISQKEDGTFDFVRSITFSRVMGTEIVVTGQSSDTLNMTPLGPNAIKTAESIDIVRVPEAN